MQGNIKITKKSQFYYNTRAQPSIRNSMNNEYHKSSEISLNTSRQSSIQSLVNLPKIITKPEIKKVNIILPSVSTYNAYEETIDDSTETKYPISIPF